ncbi:hypothetical protein EDB19DRAFT_2038111 [Suillus lakei]|nr:hypothetical protein EDB19DRAFT_2038111 [Suillus lakei]
MVSDTTWRRHLEEASTEDEKERIRTGRVLHGHSMPIIPALPTESAPSLPPSARRLETIRGLAKRAQDSAESLRKVGRRKRAKNSEPSMDNDPHILTTFCCTDDFPLPTMFPPPRCSCPQRCSWPPQPTFLAPPTTSSPPPMMFPPTTMFLAPQQRSWPPNNVPPPPNDVPAPNAVPAPVNDVPAPVNDVLPPSTTFLPK